VLGASGIWWAFPIANILSVLITLGVYAKGDWKNKRLVGSEEMLTERVSEEIFTEETYTSRQT